MDLISQIVERAKANKQRIVLPEGTEERTLKAADQLLADEVANLILIGNPDEINGLAKQWGLVNINKATIIDPENHPKQEEYAQLLCELRKKKGMTIAIEPMINAGVYQVEFMADGWGVRTKDRQPSAHYENTVAITDNGVEILTL